MKFETESFETRCSLVQDFIFTSAKAAFERYGIELSQEKYLDFGMIHSLYL